MKWVVTCSALCLILACEHAGDSFQVSVVSPLEGASNITMVQIPAGYFLMGSDFHPLFVVIQSPGIPPDTSFNYERPVHAVTVSAFKISTTEITQEQYQAVMGSNPAKFSGILDLPVENVNWTDAVRFCNRLSERAGLAPCYDLQTYLCDFGKNGFRLPTEAEWEYACRAGTGSEYNVGGDQASLARAAWYSSNSELRTQQVATKAPNNAGLYDMHGNLWEWTNDNYAFYACGSQSNPTGPARGIYRIARGGSWASAADECRSAYRRPYQQSFTASIVGFRVVRK